MTHSRGESPVVTVFTIGHSTRSAEDFMALLGRHGIRTLVDVRRYPGSRRYPHFAGEALATALPTHGIEYRHAPALGGRRRARPDSPNTSWRNESFRGYADYMGTPDFRRALDELRSLAEQRPTVIMCAEAVPWRCHRNLISDALVAAGDEVIHILDAGGQPHTLTSFARVVDGEPRYEPVTEQTALFDDSEQIGRAHV